MVAAPLAPLFSRATIGQEMRAGEHRSWEVVRNRVRADTRGRSCRGVGGSMGFGICGGGEGLSMRLLFSTQIDLIFHREEVLPVIA